MSRQGGSAAERDVEKPSPLFVSRLAIRTVLCYLVASLVWIVLSDDVAFRLPVPEHEQHIIHTYKGLALVLLMAPLLYWLLHRAEAEVRATETLRQAEAERARQELVTSQLAGRVGTWTLDLDTDELGWSDALLQLAEVKPSRFGGHFGFLAKFMPHDDFARLDYQRDRARLTGEPVRLTCRFDTPRKRTLYFELRSQVERDASGRPRRLVGSAQDVTLRLRARQRLLLTQQRLLSNQRRLLAAFEHAPLGVLIAGRDERVRWLNETARQLLGRERDEPPGGDLFEQLGEDSGAVRRECARLLEGKADRVAFDKALSRPDGTMVWLRANGSLLRDEKGAPRYFVWMLDDISARKEHEHARDEQLRARRLASAVFEFSGEALGVTDAQLRYISVNKAFERVCGYSSAEMAGRHLSVLAADAPQNDPALSALTRSLASQQAWTGELQGQRKGGELFRLLTTVTAVHDDHGAVSNYVVALSDLTQQRQLDARLERLTRTDKLTGLPNRQALEDTIARLVRTEGAAGASIGVILLGYDRFHAVNEVLGTAQADRVLRDAASRLTQSLEEGYFVARYGGARFAVVPPRGISREELAELATHCTNLLRVRCSGASGGEVMLTVSAGVSTTSPERADQAVLLSQAESALVLQEPHEHSTLRFFSPDVASQVSRRLALEAGLLQPGWRDEFQVMLQPKWDIVTKRVTGAEALLRWHSRELGQVAPGEFIDVAEEHSVILEIGRWVVSKVVEALANHRDRCPALRVAINLSARQLEDDCLPKFISQVVREAGLPPSCLEFELTETWLASNPIGARRFLADLRSLGFSVALDDFGVGYSSLASLSQLPVDVVKLDRSFVERLPESEAACVVASSMLDMANRLHMTTVAEGVETEAQREFLARAGCQHAQGWLVAPALPLADFFGRYERGEWFTGASAPRH